MVPMRYFPAMRNTGDQHRVVALVTAPQASFELGCAATVFREDPYRFTVCTEIPGAVRTLEGFDMMISSGLRTLPGAHDRGARLVSICSGAYALAATGLLDGRRAATHWRYADELQRRFPAVQVDPD